MIRSFRPLLLASAAAVAVTACSLGPPAYPKFGEASYRIEGVAASSEGAPPVQTIIYRNGPKMRVETTLASGASSMVSDTLSGESYIVTPAGPGAAPAPVSTTTSTPATTTAPATTTTTTQPAPVAATPAAGTAVRVADADAPKPIEAAWATLGAENARYVSKCAVAGEKGNKWAPKQQSPGGVSRVACITDDGIVLEIVEGSKTLWQATRVARGDQDAALFGVPPGYQVIDPQAVARAVSSTMQDLNSVAGDSATPKAGVRAPAPTPKR